MKCGWSEGFGELNWVCMMVMEKLLEYRRLASFSMGFIWPSRGTGNKINLFPFVGGSILINLEGLFLSGFYLFLSLDS